MSGFDVMTQTVAALLEGLMLHVLAAIWPVTVLVGAGLSWKIAGEIACL